MYVVEGNLFHVPNDVGNVAAYLSEPNTLKVVRHDRRFGEWAAKICRLRGEFLIRNVSRSSDLHVLGIDSIGALVRATGERQAPARLLAHAMQDNGRLDEPVGTCKMPPYSSPYFHLNHIYVVLLLT